jgi:hypothetical protein
MIFLHLNFNILTHKHLHQYFYSANEREMYTLKEILVPVSLVLASCTRYLGFKTRENQLTEKHIVMLSPTKVKQPKHFCSISIPFVMTLHSPYMLCDET